ncbi:MAG: hypothetical protein M1840_005760 [Geoglossum simile]|nr:MAG: hypothetical protein M1840_005760 [Geoglossum simile]
MQPWEATAGHLDAVLPVGGLGVAVLYRCGTSSLSKILYSDQLNPHHHLPLRSLSEGYRYLKLLYHDWGAKAKVDPLRLLRELMASEESVMRANRAGRRRPSATVNGRYASTAKISRFHAAMQTGEEELSTLAQRVEKYEELLRQISSQLDSAAQLAVHAALAKSPSPEGESAAGRSTDLGEGEEGGEGQVQAEVGSIGSLDHVDEDAIATESSKATGFLGKNSDITWMKRARTQLLESLPTKPTAAEEIPAQAERPAAGRSSSDLLFEISTYHLDDLSTSSIGDQVDPYGLPLRATADALTNSYLTTVHPAFPIISKPLFKKQYEQFFRSFLPPESSRWWLAMLNLIFAIGAIHAHLTRAEWQGDGRDHLQYFTRARILALDKGAGLETPDLQQVQVIGLCAFYLVASSQTNRAWNFNGLAIRSAQSLGLHLMNTTKSLTDAQKEMRVRIWYSIHSLEQLLRTMTGRPDGISSRDCSAPLPSAIEDDDIPVEGGPLTSGLPRGGPSRHRESRSTTQRTSRVAQTTFAAPPVPMHTRRASQPISEPESVSPPGSTPAALPGNATFFLHWVKLNILTAEVLNTLYTADTAKTTWSDAQTLIGCLDTKLSKWRSELPVSYDFGRKQRNLTFLRQRMCLGFLYNSTKAIINRPCLCRTDRKIPGESDRSKQFSRLAAHACVDAARSSLNFIPDEPNTIGLYSVSPWWCVLHHIVQAGTILVIELAFRAEHAPQDAEGILNDAKKAVNWLHAMSANNLAARRSWVSLDRLLRLAAPRVGGNTADMPQDAPDAPDTEMTGVEHTSPGHTTATEFQQADIWNQEQLLITQPPRAFNGGPQGSYPFGNMPVASPFDQFMPISSHPVFTDADVRSMFPTSSQMESMGVVEGSPQQQQRPRGSQSPTG